MRTLTALIRCMRPWQYTKNLLVFAALIFARHYTDAGDWIRALLAFVAFSLAAGAVYALNDVFDAEEDRRHPVKRLRPVASGAIQPPAALRLAAVLFLCGLALGWFIQPGVALTLAAYGLVMALYSFGLKRVLLLDIFILAGGLTARAVAGAEAIAVTISPWLLVCTFLAALVLALGKRRQELVRIGEERHRGRPSLRGAPSPRVWDRWVSLVSVLTFVAYTAYTVDPVTVGKVGSARLVLTIPFVACALYRYRTILRTSDLGENPAEVLLGDRRILLAVAGWLLVVILVLALP